MDSGIFSTGSEVTAMRCSLHVVALLIPCAAAAQVATPVAMGTRLQVFRALESASGATTLFQLQGRYAGFVREHVVLTLDRPGDTLRVPFAQVAQVKMSAGKKHPIVRDVVIGTLAGAVFGGVLDMAGVGEESLGPRRPFFDFRRAGLRELSLVGAVGGIVAASVGRTQWALVDKGALRNP